MLINDQPRQKWTDPNKTKKFEIEIMHQKKKRKKIGNQTQTNRTKKKTNKKKTKDKTNQTVEKWRKEDREREDGDCSSLSQQLHESGQWKKKNKKTLS